MAKNLEFKVRYESLDVLLPKLADLKATHRETIHQVDTYFQNPKGRLKLREADGYDEGWLIYYERPNALESRYSIYQLCKIAKPTVLKRTFNCCVRYKDNSKKTEIVLDV